jgi:hypothetical protein
MTTQKETQITIKKYGHNTNSKKFERRYLYLYIEPFDNDDLERGVRKAVDVLNSVLAVWEPPLPRKFFRPDMWWEHVSCSYCKRRMEYELEKWKANEYVWKRGMCMRHWLVYHLSMIVPDEPTGLISNQPISIVADDKAITFNIETINYKYNIKINKEVAEMEVNYKGKLYRFTYRNHLRGHPLLSSYMNILFDVYYTMEIFRDFLLDYVLKRRLYSNVVINDSITLPPTSPTEGGCQL